MQTSEQNGAHTGGALLSGPHRASTTRRFAVTTANHPWGRVDPDGTVYVRTAEGERVIGSWQAGSPEEALAFYRRKYESLETEVTLLEQRLNSTDLSPSQAQASVERLRKTVTGANASDDPEGRGGAQG